MKLLRTHAARALALAAFAAASCAAPDVGSRVGREAAPADASSAGRADTFAAARARASEHLRAIRSIAPAVSAAVALRGEIVFAGAVGLANTEAGERAGADTRFRIGSTSKALTAAALGTLVDDGRIDLDAPLRSYLPGCPDPSAAVTARQLAGHQAGVRHYRGFEFMSRRRYERVTGALAVFADDALLFEPGTAYAYSSYGFTLLSAAMEAADGRPFLELMEARVFGPVGMSSTGPEFSERDAEGRATYYQLWPDGVARPAAAVELSNKWAGGGFESTPTDLATFGAALLERRLVEEATRELLFTPQLLANGEATGEGYGIGWRSGEGALPASREKVRIVHHGGSSMGARSFLVLLPDEGVVVSLLVNSNGSGVPFGPFVERAMEFAEIFVEAARAAD